MICRAGLSRQNFPEIVRTKVSAAHIAEKFPEIAYEGRRRTRPAPNFPENIQAPTCPDRLGREQLITSPPGFPQGFPAPAASSRNYPGKARLACARLRLFSENSLRITLQQGILSRSGDASRTIEQVPKWLYYRWVNRSHRAQISNISASVVKEPCKSYTDLVYLSTVNAGPRGWLSRQITA